MSYSSDFLSDFDAYRLHFSEIAWTFQKSWIWSWATSFCLFPGFLVPEHILFRKCFWETYKTKLGNSNINCFGNFKQFLKKVAYWRPNLTKTRWVMIKWIFEKIEVFKFFWKKSWKTRFSVPKGAKGTLLPQSWKKKTHSLKFQWKVLLFKKR